MSETLTGGAISTVYKKLVFTKATSGSAGDIFYTLDADGITDTALTTLTSPLTFTGLITATGGGIKLGSIFDSNGKLSITCTDTGSAVNYLNVTNAATTNAVTVDVAGSDTNIGLTLNGKGSGVVTSTPKFVATAGVQLGNNVIYASDGGSTITLDTSDNVTIGGDLTVSGGDIFGIDDSTLNLKSDDNMSFYIDYDQSADADTSLFYWFASTATQCMSLSEAGVLITEGKLQVKGNIIESSTGGDVMTLNGNDITFLDDVTIGGNVTIGDAKNINFTNSSGLDITDQAGVDYIQFRSAGMTFDSNKTVTLAGTTTISGAANFTGNAGNTPGTGITGAATCKSYVERFGEMIKTTIYLDLTGLRHTANGDILGDDGTANPCHIGQITTAKNGVIVCGQMTCMEVPTASNVDIDLYTSTSATEVEDTPISGIAGSTISINGGNQTLGKITPVVDDAGLPDANDYLYLTCVSTDGDADYAIGKLLFEFWGIAS